MYYNARYYAPSLGRFVSADTMVPGPANPKQFNRYTYSLGNPILLVDPTGHWTCASDELECGPPPKKQYDVTKWLVNEMVTNVNSPEFRAMFDMFPPPPLGPGPVGHEWSGAVLNPIDFYENNTGWGLWDIKREMEVRIGKGIVMCGIDGCRWFDYSTPGNIHYGYLAAASGVPIELSMAAGGFLEVRDETAKWKNWDYLFEDPQDYAGVEFGYYLYETFGDDLTVEEFYNALTTDVMDALQPAPRDFKPPHIAQMQNNSYSPGAFSITASP